MYRPRTKQGLSLLECLVYLAIFSCIVLCSMQLLVHLWRHGINWAHTERSYMVFHSAYDTMQRDIHQAPAITEWKEKGPHAFIWNTSKQDVGWVYDQNKLFRITGIYHTKTQKWGPYHKNLVARITNTTPIVTGAECVTITLKDEYAELQGSIACRENHDE